MRKRFICTILTILLTTSLCFAGSVTKGLIGKQDTSPWDGVTSTFTRATSAGYTITLNKIDWPGVDVLAVYGGGVNRTDDTITTALTAIGTSNKVAVWLSPGTWTFNENVDWSSYTNVTFQAPPGVLISHGAYTINIPNPNAGVYQWLSGTGAETFSGSVKEVYPEWWGIDGTADQVQFQAANDSLTSGGTIRGSGTYSFSAALNLSSNIHLTGNGKASSITTVGDIYAINISGAAPYPNDIRGVLVENLAIYGTGTPTTGGGIYATDIHECIFQNLWISDHSKTLYYGIYLNGSTNNDTDNNIIQNNIITKVLNTAINLYTLNPYSVEENVISGNVITGAAWNGITVVGDRNTIIGNTIEESGNNGIVISNGQWNTISGNTACESGSHGISIEAASSENTIIGNVVKDNDLANTATYNGINVNNGDRNTIVGNVCYDNDNYEIYINGTSSNNIVMGNACWGSDREGVIVDVGIQTTLAHNLENSTDIDTDHIRLATQAAILKINGVATTGLGDSAYADWDLDTDLTVPTNAIGIIFEVAVQDSGAGATDQYARFKKKGGDTEFTARCLSANDRYNHIVIMVEFDANHMLQYMVEASGADTLDLSIKLVGWIME